MIGIKLLYSPTLPISPGLIMTGSTFLDQDIDLDCNCGMGAKCLLVRRKHEKAKIIQRQEQHSQHSSSRSVYHFNKELTKMSKWNNIADLTQHRETIKVRNLKNYIRERFEFFWWKVSFPDLEKSFSVVTYNILADCHMEPHWWAARRFILRDWHSE